MKELPYADTAARDGLPGVRLTADVIARLDAATLTFDEIVANPGVVAYALGQTLGWFYTTLMTEFGAIVGEEQALELAYAIGRRHGALNYGKFLENRGLPGGPKSLCEYQDFGHSIRGPRHTSALFAKYDDNSVIVTRSDCVFFSGTRGTPNPYLRALERGTVDGYKDVDPRLTHVETIRCLCLGDIDGCECRFVFE